MEEIQKSFGDDEDVLRCTEELHAAERGFREIAAQLESIVQIEEDKVISTVIQLVMHFESQSQFCTMS